VIEARFPCLPIVAVQYHGTRWKLQPGWQCGCGGRFEAHPYQLARWTIPNIWNR